MAGTHRTSYEGYHTSKRRAGTAVDTIIKFGTTQCLAAYNAVRGSQLDRWKVVICMLRVLEELGVKTKGQQGSAGEAGLNEPGVKNQETVDGEEEMGEESETAQSLQGSVEMAGRVALGAAA